MKAGPVDLLAQPARRGVLEVMGFIDDQVVVFGQQATSDLGVREEERVVHDDKIRRLGFGAGPVYVAVLFRAVDAHAIERIGGDASPRHLLAAVEAQL